MFTLPENYFDVAEFYRKPPLLASPKLNGVRAMWRGGVLRSREGKVFREDTLAHIYAALRSLPPSFDLDGELYLHGVPFWKINGAVNIHRCEANDIAARMEFHIHDLPADGRIAQLRFEALTRLALPSPALKATPHYLIKDAAGLDKIHNSFVAAGYEGTVYKHPLALYFPRRTHFLMRRKAWKDAEFVVVALVPGEGASNKNSIGALTLTDKHGNSFNCTLTETAERDAWTNLARDVKPICWPLVKVRFLELTEKGTPSQPIYEGRV